MRAGEPIPHTAGTCNIDHPDRQSHINLGRSGLSPGLAPPYAHKPAGSSQRLCLFTSVRDLDAAIAIVQYHASRTSMP
jgi:hypothetical protein